MTRGMAPGAVLGAVLLLSGCARPVPVAEVHPVCLHPDVVDFVQAELARRDLYASVLPLTVSERSVPGLPGTQCGVYVRQIAFNTPVDGNAAAVGLVPVSYSVRPVVNGFVVEVGPVQPRRR